MFQREQRDRLRRYPAATARLGHPGPAFQELASTWESPSQSFISDALTHFKRHIWIFMVLPVKRHSKLAPCGRGGWSLSRPQRSSANPEAPHKTIRRFLLSDTRTGGSLRRSNPSIHQPLLVRQVAQVFQPEGHQKMFRRHKGIRRASPRASRPRSDQAARMQSTDQVAADFFAKDVLQPIASGEWAKLGGQGRCCTDQQRL